MSIELTQEQSDLIVKALKGYHYVVERALNRDKLLNKEQQQLAVEEILLIRSINKKLNPND